MTETDRAREGLLLVGVSCRQAYQILEIQTDNRRNQGHSRRESSGNHQVESRCGHAQVKSSSDQRLLPCLLDNLLHSHLPVSRLSRRTPNSLRGPHHLSVSGALCCLCKYLKRAQEGKEIMQSPLLRGQMNSPGRQSIGRGRRLKESPMMPARWKAPCLRVRLMRDLRPTELRGTLLLRVSDRTPPTVTCRRMRKILMTWLSRHCQSAGGHPCLLLLRPVV